MNIAKQCASSPHLVPNQAPSGPQFVFTFLQTIASLTLCDYAFGDVVVRYILVCFLCRCCSLLSLLVSLLACLKIELLIVLLWVFNCWWLFGVIVGMILVRFPDPLWKFHHQVGRGAWLVGWFWYGRFQLDLFVFSFQNVCDNDDDAGQDCCGS